MKKKKLIYKNKENFFLVKNIENIYESYFPNSKLIKLYKSADLYLNFSRDESFGITFVEALASGLPVISFNTKGANEIIRNNYNGIIIKNYKNKSYVNKISEISKDKILLNALQSNTLKSVKRYDLDQVSKKVLKIFKKIN